MKKLFVIAALLITSGVIFVVKSQSKETEIQAPAKTTTQQWYDFNGGDETLPGNYTLRTSETPPSCIDGNVMCAVKAEPHGSLPGKPDLTDPYIEERREN